jgi:DNA-binding protein H-NS
MTQSYSQIQKQIQALQLKAERLRDKEIEGVVARIRVAIEHYGLTPEQLFARIPTQHKTRRAAAAGVRTARYADEQGNTWGGIGKRPDWLRAALAAGRTLEEFATNAAAKPNGSRAVVKRKKSRVAYHDDAGHSWSGMGPRPRWLKEALEAGKTLEEMSA